MLIKHNVYSGRYNGLVARISVNYYEYVNMNMSNTNSVALTIKLQTQAN